MLLYTVMLPEGLFDEESPADQSPWQEPAGEAPAGRCAGGLGGRPVARDLFLGWSGGVPVWAEAVRAADGWVLVRLLATDPALFLAPSLAPGSRLLLPF